MQIYVFTYAYIYQKLLFDLLLCFLPLGHVFGAIFTFSYISLKPLVIDGIATGYHLLTCFLKYM